MKTIKAAFLDRDGTINVEKGYLNNPDDVELYPNAAKAIKRFNDAGFVVFGISNQSGIARGYFTADQVREVNGRVMELLVAENAEVKEILFCPHHPKGIVPEFSIPCECRKPGTGMVKTALEKYGFTLSESVVIGDKICDVELGKNIGARTALVETGYGKEEMVKIGETGSPKPDFFASGLWEATLLLLNGHR